MERVCVTERDIEGVMLAVSLGEPVMEGVKLRDMVGVTLLEGVRVGGSDSEGDTEGVTEGVTVMVLDRDTEGLSERVGVTEELMDGEREVVGLIEGDPELEGVTDGEPVIDGVTLEVGEGVRDVVCEQRELHSASEMLHSVQFVKAVALRSSSATEALRYHWMRSMQEAFSASVWS